MYRLIVILLLSLVNTIQVAFADNLERLFTSAAERLELEITRTKPEGNETKIEKEKVDTKPPQHITFNGLISRSDGATTVWVNGSEELLRPGFSIKPEDRQDIAVPIVLSKARQEIWLKPGETLSALDGKIFQNYDSNFSNPKSESEKLASRAMTTTASLDSGSNNSTSSVSSPSSETKQCKIGKLCGDSCIAKEKECSGKQHSTSKSSSAESQTTILQQVNSKGRKSRGKK